MPASPGSAVAADVQTDDLIAVTGADTAYDAAHSRFGVMFFEDPPAGVRQHRRRLAPGRPLRRIGVAGLSANPFMAVPTLAALEPLGVTDLPLPEPGAPGPFSMADPDATRALSEDAGFVDVEVEAVDVPVAVAGDGQPWAVQAMRVGPLAAAYESADPEAQRATIEAVLTALDDPHRVGLRGRRRQLVPSPPTSPDRHHQRLPVVLEVLVDAGRAAGPRVRGGGVAARVQEDLGFLAWPGA